MKIDIDDPAHTALVEALRVEGLPTIAAIGPGGRLIASHPGYLDDAQFLRMIRQAVDGSKQHQ